MYMDKISAEAIKYKDSSWEYFPTTSIFRV